MDTEKLILEVEAYPIIYDVSHANYKDNHKKEKAWKEIAAVFGVDGKDFYFLLEL